MQIFTGTPLADNQVQVIVNVNGKVADMSIFEIPPSTGDPYFGRKTLSLCLYLQTALWSRSDG